MDPTATQTRPPCYYPQSENKFHPRKWRRTLVWVWEPSGYAKRSFCSSAAVLGPLDMGYLTHNPLHKRMMGADHFVLAYRFEKDGVLIHDPEGFPSVLLPLRQLELAWRADSIPYRH